MGDNPMNLWRKDLSQSLTFSRSVFTQSDLTLSCKYNLKKWDSPMRKLACTACGIFLGCKRIDMCAKSRHTSLSGVMLPEWQLGSSHIQLTWTWDSWCLLEYSNLPPPPRINTFHVVSIFPDIPSGLPPFFSLPILAQSKVNRFFFSYQWIFHCLVI